MGRSAGAGGPGWAHCISASSAGVSGAHSAPLQRGHQARRRSRTFHRVPQREHT
jgi:hypothetical protein